MEFDKTPHATQTPLPTQIPTQNQLTIQSPQLPSQTRQVLTQTPQVPTPQVPTQTKLPTQTPITMSCARAVGGPHVVVEDVSLSSVTNIVRPNPLLSRDFCPMQKLWDRHVQEVYHLCDPCFWNMLEVGKLQNTTCVDNVLSTCSEILNKNSVSITKCWSRTKRTLREFIRRKLGNF